MGNGYKAYCELKLVDVQVALLLIDEVHLLNDSRGAALEAGVVSRIKLVSKLPSMQAVRLSPCAWES